jgi:hypothetical protein
MQHLGPRLIVNRSGARNSNLVHGVSLKPGAPSPEALAIAMASSLTLLSAEIEGRAYGGGVLKLETKEAEHLLVPPIPSPEALPNAIAVVEGLIRCGNVKDAAQLVDRSLGIQHHIVWRAYLTMRRRRLGRRRRGTS